MLTASYMSCLTGELHRLWTDNVTNLPFGKDPISLDLPTKLEWTRVFLRRRVLDDSRLRMQQDSFLDRAKYG